jgi:hypothetical protein
MTQSGASNNFVAKITGNLYKQLVRLARSSLLGVVLCLLLSASASAAVQPTLTASGSNVEVGGNIHATATLSGSAAATEAPIAFKLFGPGDAACVNTPVFTDSANVAGDGEYSSGNFPTTELGTYHWSAEYPGDAENEPASSLCVATSTVPQATPDLTSIATNGTAGGSVSDTATLASGFNPTGTLTFKAFGPNNATCSGAAAYTNAVAVSGNAAYGSGPLNSPLAGEYRWTIEYSGDTNNAATSSGCNAVNETSTVSKATPALSTNATNGTVGGTIKDTATLAAGVLSPTGNLVFKAFGPNDSSCAGTVAFTHTVAASGNAAYDSTDFTTSAAGTYRWTVEYAGDANNNSATSPCNSANESSIVGKLTPTLSSTATNAVTGGSVSDTATLASGFNPTGTLTFKAFGPNDATCSGAPAFTHAVAVNNGNASYNSTNFANVPAGEYRWTIDYAGDANNNSATSPCNAANETSSVGKATPTLSSAATNGTVGGTIKDTATLAAGASPTGNLVFKAFGPNNSTCAAAAAFSKTVTVSGNGPYDSTDFAISLAGAYRWTVEYAGDANNNGVTSGCNAANETSTVGKATSTISSTATNGTIGGTIKDTATVTGVGPTGNLVFKAFGPNDASCSGLVAFTNTASVSGNGTYESTNFTPNMAGAYRWTVEYAGDANNNGITSGCNAANETSTVAQVTPTLSSTATSGTAGGAIKDTATLVGGFTPTGNLVFKAFGPSDATCAGTVAFTKTVPVNGNATYDSTNFANVKAGQYRWTVAYSGDTNNIAAASACNAPNETSTVAKASPTISTAATNPGAVGGTIKDTATLAAGSTPTGSLVFKVFVPANATCSGAAAFTATVPISGNGSYGSTDFAPSTMGEYRWTVEYAGDTDNNAATSACNAPNETSVVAKGSPTLTSAATSAVFPGSISDTATIAGGVNPTGTLTFRAFGPNNATCSGVADFTSNVSVNSGNAGYGSGAFSSPQPQIGTYRWTVDYSGDANHNSASSGCNATGGSSTVSKVPPQLSVSTTNATVGGSIASFATFGGGLSHTGSIVLRLYGPNDTTCSGAPAFSSPSGTVTPSNGTYASGPFTPAQAGAYRWTATYSGDATNAAETTSCTAGVSTIAPAKPSISAHLLPTAITLGEGVGDSATLSGGFKAGGTITFSLFGPANTTCSGSPALTSTASVSGDGTYSSAQLVPSKPGDYRFVVSYSGDASNTATTASCGTGGEFVTVGKRTPTLKGRAAVRSKKIVAKATLGGATSPTGKITFRIFAPNDSRCARTPIFVSKASIKGTVATAAGYRFTRVGLYRFSLAYSGDERNASAKSACTVRGQSIRIK